MSDRPPTLNDILAGQFILKRDIGGGRYTLKREIGRGGAATVLLARDERHERFVAVKLLHPELSHALGAQRFLREIKLTASLQHPHILPIHDSGESGEQLYYVMPFIEGQSLRERLGAEKRLPIEEAVRIGREVAGALAYAHERGVVHRDIKPENILFSGGHAVVADFGIARAIDRATEKITQQGTITGTPTYMSPEQARDRAFDGRSDVYSLACVLYEAIAGVPPFSGDTPQQQLSARLARTPRPLREHRRDVPPAVEAAIAKALATSPDDRYPDARAFSTALSAAIGNSADMAPPPSAGRSPMRSPWTVAAAVVIVAAFVALSPPVRERIEDLTVRVDSGRIAVVPFRYAGSTPPNLLADPAASGVQAALERWDGLKVASDASVHDAMRGGNHALQLDDVLRVARSVHAGRVVWGRIVAERDSAVVRAALYDALTGESLREATRTVSARGPSPLRAVDYQSLVADLLRTARAPMISAFANRGTTSYAAWQAFEQAALALGRWDVDVALRALDSAVAADPGYPQANLWAAQLRAWRRAPAREWTASYIIAERGRATLDPRERLMAEALGAMSRGDHAAACRGYSALRDLDTLNAAPWLDLAECRVPETVK